MIDSHCHFDFDVFNDKRVELDNQLSAAKVEALLIPGTQHQAFDNQLKLTLSKTQLFFTLGFHPYFLSERALSDCAVLEKYLVNNLGTIVGVGEIGLDYGIAIDPELQRKVFEIQLDISKNFNLPLVLHHRKSHNDLIRLLKAHKVENGGVVHAFSGSLQEAHSYIDMGFALGAGGTITYPRAQKTREVFSRIPSSSILLETDAPDMPINGRQGEPNSPLYLPEVLSSLAEIRQQDQSEIDYVTTENFKRIFKIK